VNGRNGISDETKIIASLKIRTEGIPLGQCIKKTLRICRCKKTCQVYKDLTGL